jgi:hydrogenase/urease accessory protein HupE
MRSVTASLAAAMVLCAAAHAVAHPVPFSYLDLRLPAPAAAAAPKAIEGSLVVHIFDVAHDLQIEPMELLLDPDNATFYKPALTALLTPRLHVLADGRELTPEWLGIEPILDQQSLRLRVRFVSSTPIGALAVSARLFPYDPQHQTFLNIYEGSVSEGEALTQAMLDSAHDRFDYFAGTRQGTLAVVARLLPTGIEHILIGPDHILFLIGLLLTGGSIRQLAVIVTAFTVAHSITLSLAALNILTPPARIIEPAIALSIIYVGADNLLVRRGQGRDMRVWIAFGFGFIHGFGFASVLREMELPRHALVWSLLSFNVGVEIGQLLIVLVVASALAWIRARNESAGRQLAFAGSIVVILAGAWWFIQRVFFPGGIS